MLSKELIEKAKGLSREERMKLLMESKSDLSAIDLEKVSGGQGSVEPGNPNSEIPDGNSNFWSSWGFTCQGKVQC